MTSARSSAPSCNSEMTLNGGDREKAATLTSKVEAKAPDVYDRFTSKQKTRIVAIVSYTAFIGPITSSSFMPSIPAIARDINASPSAINYTVAIFLVMLGVAPLLWAPLSGFYGRRPIYLASMPIHIAASIGVAFSTNLGALIGTRILQAIGSSAVLAVGAGTVGDIYRPTERATAMGWFYSGILIGPTVAPVIAGVLTEYTAPGWKSMQFLLAALAAVSVALVAFFLPETSHGPLPHEQLCRDRGKKFVPYIFNPLTSLGLLRWPNIRFICLASSCIMFQLYILLVPLGTVFEQQYNISNEALLGCVYIPSGVGNVIGSRFGGVYADYIVRKGIEKRGVRVPEDRLKSTIWAAAIGCPLTCLAFGWLVHTGAGGVYAPLVFMFLNGILIMIVLAPSNTYCVDSLQSRSAEVIAVNNCIRYIFAAAASACVLPMQNGIGIGPSCTIGGGIVAIAAAATFITMRYGQRWRERADERYGVPPKQVAEDRVDQGVTPSDHHDEGQDATGELPTRPGQHRMRTGSRSTKTELPVVEEVLKRTVSMHSATAQQ